ncbi:hypothetical protein B0H17DRAFT_1072807 [Mycena rosella]|uniref:G-protein coupled receptors family 2 profile 2 domain-containing protein n=1 Tax=Mycena rosella TaxID=1033263 RepID=A0AAD7GFS6_MYCRO|nr:hypothetical protein B0H17DRAFT_1072807 [Mycena rosella]
MLASRLDEASYVATLYPKILLGLGVPGFVLTVFVLALYAVAAWNRTSRRFLDRVSFRLLVYALLANLVFSVTFPTSSLNAYPGWRCNLLAFLANLSLMFSTTMFFCMALNLPLVLVYRRNGQSMEKYYVLVSALLCAVTNGTAYATGHLGWSAVNKTCWYRSTSEVGVIRWMFGTQTFWLLLMSVGEVVAFLTIVGYLIVYERTTRRFRPGELVSVATHSTASLPPPGSTIVMFRGIIFRIGLYPLVSCLLTISGAFLDLDEMKHRNRKNLDFRLDLTDLSIYGSRPLIYGILAATDPSFLRALREICYPTSTHSNSTQASLGADWARPCLSTIIEFELELELSPSTQSSEQSDSLNGTATTAVHSRALSATDKELEEGEGAEPPTANQRVSGITANQTASGVTRASQRASMVHVVHQI